MSTEGEDKSSNGDKGRDFYEVLGLNKECSPSELRNAYKKLALRWHPDRCSASGNSKSVDEAKKNFQAIQQAYSVLSDTNKRFLYDVGVYASDDDENEMGDFLNEMAVMMSQTNANEHGEESFEDLQVLFEEMLQEEVDTVEANRDSTTSFCMPYSSCTGQSFSFDKHNCPEFEQGKGKAEDFLRFESHPHSQKLSLGVDQKQEFKKGKGVRGGTQGAASGGSGSRRRQQQQQHGTRMGKTSSSSNYGISAV